MVGLGLVAGACGNGTDGNGAAGGDLPLLPGSTSAGGGASSGRAAAEMAADEDASSTMSGGAAAACIAPPPGAEPAPCNDTGFAPYQPIEYRLAADLDQIGGSAPAYRLEADVDETAVAKLANAVGATGEVRREGDGFVVGTMKGEETSTAGYQLYVGPDGSWSVSFLNEAAAGRSTASASATCSPDGVCTDVAMPEPAPEPPKPASLLSNADAEKAARELFEKAGMDLDDIEFSVQRSDYDVNVAGVHTLDGLDIAGVGTFASFGDKGQLMHANGTLADPSLIGDYPLVSTSEAFDRAGGGEGGGRIAIATDMGAGTSSGGGSSGSAGGTAEPTPATDEPTKESMPAESVTPEERAPDMAPVSTLPPKVVELTTVRRVLIAEYGMCPGDPIYLVPAYVYGTNGNADEFGPVPAVVDQYLASAQHGDEPGEPDTAAGTGSSSDPDEPVSSDEEAKLENPCPGVGRAEPAREADG